MSSPTTPPSDNRSPWRYLGLATQIMACLALSVWAGMRIDRWIGSFPFLTICFPLLVLIVIFYQIIRDTR